MDRSIVSNDGSASSAVAARALPSRLDARGRRRARVHDVDGLAAARGPGSRGGDAAHRARGPDGAADTRRTAARRPRGDDPRRARGRPRGPRPGGRARRRRARRRVRHGDPALTRAGGRRAGRDASRVELQVREHEPPEAMALLADDDVDLALIYDYNLAPRAFDRDVSATPLWTGALAPRRPGRRRPGRHRRVTRRAAQVRGRPLDRELARYLRRDALLAIAALAGFVPRFTHRADSLDLVQDLIVAGLGVGLLPADEPLREGVRRLDLRDPEAELRSYAVTRLGREAWAPLALVTRSIEGHPPPGSAGSAIAASA